MEKLLQKPVKDFMTKKVISAHENDGIKDLFQKMDKNGILGLPVVDDDNRVIGIVTEGDLIQHFTTLETPRGVHLLGSMIFLDDLHDFNESLKDHCAETVKDIMNEDVITLIESSTLQNVIDVMAEANVNRLPVVDKQEKLVGIITRSDVVHQLAKMQAV